MRDTNSANFLNITDVLGNWPQRTRYGRTAPPQYPPKPAFADWPRDTALTELYYTAAARELSIRERNAELFSPSNQDKKTLNLVSGAMRELARMLMGHAKPLDDHEWKNLEPSFLANAEANPVLWRQPNENDGGVRTSLLGLPELTDKPWLAAIYAALAQPAQERSTVNGWKFKMQFHAVTTSGTVLSNRPADFVPYPISYSEIDGRRDLVNVPRKIALFVVADGQMQLPTYPNFIEVSEKSVRELATKAHPQRGLDL
jgi:hypothetical protein